ncbi:MAG: hypothetical protein OXF72_13020 [Gammaproteobacteria bacterium]|nr:hypothetical protein [Gammaproteobacteria bacterium]MCY4276856.1 hypothetical protein [Gammaproteobacteria bacterium]MCY4323684.1 hypothetical protein [Gammaproteobacteria bacterium]
MNGPLSGIKVLDLSAFVACPLCVGLLAEYGFETDEISDWLARSVIRC